MTWANFLFFAASTFLVSAAPGANMIFAFQCGMNYGVKKTLWVMAGLMLGLFVLLFTSLFGLSLISAKMPWLLTVIKLAGAAYLLYLGVRSYRDSGSHLQEGVLKAAPASWQLFKNGIWVSLSNPKAILFFVAFFPKFIDFSQPLLPQYAILVVGFFLIENLWQFIYAGSGKKLADWLNQGQRLMWLNRICGLIFMLIGLMLVWEVWIH
ncbi:LysE family translocator [Neisseria perflava]|uniref:LysE family translocator n=1 Tax=Neisseria perflava TaxID=33053 RepID=UPI00209FCFD4|nr:LysE family translocator [Neisseria perflava]MCP1659654.1 threonine/homoserine/homoserine lactone efflux protein [Neisseria perflava]MCP1771326.1 threonine/homoserine/homoserine lactone efflux protein [Neisseria perflava]